MTEAGGGDERPKPSDIRAALLELPEPLELLVEGWRGLEGRVDFVTRDPTGRAVLVHWADPDGALWALAHLAAQRAELEARLPDWAQLDPSQPPEALLLGFGFSAPVRLAAAAFTRPVALGRWWPARATAAIELPPGWGEAREPGNPPVGGLRPRSSFRTRLGTEDL